MPDITRKTISATESPALFNVSPYVTRWMLYQKFANGVDIDAHEDGRMSWGKKLQPLVIAQAAEELRLEVRPNADDAYHSRGLLGCTRDATIICPDRGPGALETKCVFDYATWMRDWGGGKSVPRQNEIQLQQQMAVGDENPYEWGVIAVWVGGEVHYFERKPIRDLWVELVRHAQEFFNDITEKREPEPFGATVELPWLTALLPTVKGNTLDLSDGADDISNTASMYAYHKAQESQHGKAAECLRAKLLAIAKDHDEVRLPGGANLRVSTTKVAAQVRKESVQKRLKVFVPEDFVAAETPRNEMPADILAAG